MSTVSTPIDARLEHAGDHRVSSPILCVITRFHLRNPLYLLLTYLDFRRVSKQVSQTQTTELLRFAFLIENLTTCYSFSIWANRTAIPRFGTKVPFHVEAARNVFRRAAFAKNGSPEIWSTKLCLDSVSNNLNWNDLDLRSLLFAVSK